MPFDQFERKISARFAEAQIPPRPEVWQNIENQLASSRSRRKGFFWLLGDGLFAAALLLGIISAPGISYNVEAQFSQIAQAETVGITDILVAEDCPDYAESQSVQSNPVTPTFAENPSQPADHSAAKREVSAKRTITYMVEKAQLPEKTVTSDPQILQALISPETNRAQPSIAILQEAGAVKDVSIDKMRAPVTQVLKTSEESAIPLENLPDLKIKRWAFYAQTSPEWAFDIEKPDVIAVSQSDQANNRSFDYSSVESSFLSSGSQFSPGEILSVRFPRAHFQAAAGGEYYLLPNLSLQAGFGYSVSEYGIFRYGSLNSAIADQLTNNPNGQLVITLSSFDFQPEEIFRTEQLELPVGMNYYLRRGRSSLVLSAGISANRLVSRRTEYKANTVDLENNFGRNTLSTLPTPDAELLVYRKYHLYGSFSALYQYQLKPEWAIFAGPQLKYQFADVFAGSAAQDQLPYRLGLQIGVRFFPGR